MSTTQDILSSPQDRRRGNVSGRIFLNRGVLVLERGRSRGEDATLAGRIRLGMAQAGLRSVSDLARKMKVNRQTVHRWVDGQGEKLTPEMLFNLADALNVSPKWLALGPPESPVPPRQLDPDTTEIIQIKEALERAKNDEALSQWVSHGRTLVKILAPASTSNPFPIKNK